MIDPYDEAFGEPEKIIGRILTSEEAEAEEDKGNFVTEVGNGEYRRILAAPKPQKIVELETIRTLADAGQVVIAAGGGGILNKDTDKETLLDTVSVADARKYIDENQFTAGSMLPKIEAAVAFAEKGNGHRTIITDIAHAKDGYKEKAGTIIK